MKTSKRNGTPRQVGAFMAAGLLTALLGPAALAARHHAHYAAARGAYGGQKEYTLAGIRIGDSYKAVLHRFGNPNETQLERISLVSGTAGGPGGGGTTVPLKIFVGPSSSGNTGAPGAGGGFPGAGGPGGGGFPGAGGPGGGGFPGGALGGLGALGGGALFARDDNGPGFGGPPAGFGGPPAGFGGPPAGFGGPPGGFPGAPGGFRGGAPGGFPGAGGAAGPGAGSLITPDHPEFRWIYDEPSATALEFTFSPEGRVEQIHAIGLRGFVKTLRGVVLGMKYSQITLAYGIPQKQYYDGSVLTLDYTDSAHASFQFYNQRLIGITVAQVK